MLAALNGAFKILCFALVVCFFLIIGSLINISVSNIKLRRRILSRLTSYVSTLCLRVGRIDVLTSGQQNLEAYQNYLIVANHMGMMDILAISRLMPSIFVTSIELKESPVVGWLAEAGGCEYVERRNRLKIKAEVETIRQALLDGLNVVVFPEAKSTNGDFVHPFKKSLFVSCANTKAKILPVTINYLEINGNPVCAQNRDFVCWYGNQPFHEALWRLMTNFTTKIELIIHSSLVLHSEEDRHQIAVLSHSMVQSKFISLNR